MATAITTTPQNITGDFDLIVRRTSGPGGTVLLQKSLGPTTVNWKTLAVLPDDTAPQFVKNTGANSYRIEQAVDGIVVEFEQ